MKKGLKKWFTGEGPFSEINIFSTRIQMAKAIKCCGIGGDAVHQALENFEDPEFVEGVVNAHKIATDPDYGREE